MIRNILHTVASKSGMALLNFALMMISARWLGPAFRGEVSLIITSASIINLIAGMAGGPKLMNISQQFGYRDIWKALFTWQLGIVFLIGATVYFIQAGFSWHYAAMGLLLVAGQSIQYLLIGRNKIKIYNYSQLLQAGLPLLFLIMGYSFNREPESLKNVLISGLYVGYLLPILISISYLPATEPKHPKFTIAQWLQMGAVSQLSNILQLINYRLVFYMAGIWGAPETLGEMAVAMALGESVWIVGRSISVVSTGAWIDGSADSSKPQKLSIQTFIISLFGMIALASIPQSWLQWVIGEKYIYTHEYLCWLAPGIVIFSLQFPYASWFAARGNYQPANWASAVGLVCMIAGYIILPHEQSFYLLIPPTIGYMVSTALFLYHYHQQKHEPLSK